MARQFRSTDLLAVIAIPPLTYAVTDAPDVIKSSPKLCILPLTHAVTDPPDVIKSFP